MFANFFKKSSQTTQQVSYPLAESDALSGEALKKFVIGEQLYKIGPFYCDRSPDSHKGTSTHAIDFIVKDGSFVYAAKSGTVVDVVESNEMYGPTPDYANYLNYVTIDHGTFYSQYAHLKKNSPSSYGIYNGKNVVQGQIIGIVGKTGWVDYGENGDHLHFMLFRGTKDSYESIPVDFEERARV